MDFTVYRLEAKLGKLAMQHFMAWFLGLSGIGPASVSLLLLLNGLGAGFDLSLLCARTGWTDTFVTLGIIGCATLFGILFFRLQHAELLTQLRAARLVECSLEKAGS